MISFEEKKKILWRIIKKEIVFDQPNIQTIIPATFCWCDLCFRLTKPWRSSPRTVASDCALILRIDMKEALLHLLPLKKTNSQSNSKLVHNSITFSLHWHVYELLIHPPKDSGQRHWALRIRKRAHVIRATHLQKPNTQRGTHIFPCKW